MSTVLVVSLAVLGVGLVVFMAMMLALHVRRGQHVHPSFHARFWSVPQGTLPMLNTNQDGPRHQPLPPTFFQPLRENAELPKLHREMPEYGLPAISWNETVPWRPGDPSNGAAPARNTYGNFGSGSPFRLSEHDLGRGYERGQAHLQPDASDTDDATEQRAPAPAATPSRRSFQWSEDSREYQSGDRVRSGVNINNSLGLLTTVPADTKGKVVGTRLGLFGDKHVTVEFENGYTGEVRASSLERRSWWD